MKFPFFEPASRFTTRHEAQDVHFSLAETGVLPKLPPPPIRAKLPTNDKALLPYSAKDTPFETRVEAQ